MSDGIYQGHEMKEHRTVEPRPVGLSIAEADLVVLALDSCIRNYNIQATGNNIWALARRIELDSLNVRARRS